MEHAIYPDRYYSLLFSIEYTAGELLGYVWRSKSGGPWRLDYRFRYFDGRKVERAHCCEIPRAKLETR